MEGIAVSTSRDHACGLRLLICLRRAMLLPILAGASLSRLLDMQPRAHGESSSLGVLNPLIAPAASGAHRTPQLLH